MLNSLQWRKPKPAHSMFCLGLFKMIAAKHQKAPSIHQGSRRAFAIYVPHVAIHTMGSLANLAVAMAFQSIGFALRSWRQFGGTAFLLKIIGSVKFKDGIREQALSDPAHALTIALDSSGHQPESARRVTLRTVNS